MDSVQKRDRDRKARQRRQEKEDRKKDRAEQKTLRGTMPEQPIPPDENNPGPNPGPERAQNGN